MPFLPSQLTTDTSIIVPCKDSGIDLCNCLASISMQTARAQSVILVDDSHDDFIFDKVIPLFPRLPIEYVRGSNSGLPSALNLGFSRATSTYLTWLNSDDYYFNHNSLLNLAKVANTSAFFAYANSVYLSPSYPMGKSLKAWRNYLNAYDGSMNIFTGSLIFSASAWSLYGGFPENLSLAFEYSLLSFLFNHYQGMYINQAVAVFNDHGNNLSSINANELQAQKQSLNLLSHSRIRSLPDRLLSSILNR